MNRSGVLWALCAAAFLARGQTLESLSRTWSREGTAASRAALERWASEHSGESGALAWLSIGAGEIERDRSKPARESLSKAAPRLGRIGDLVSLLAATAAAGEKDWAAATAEAGRVLAFEPSSPWRGRAAVLAARALIQRGSANEAIEILERFQPDLPQPSGGLALGASLEAAGVSGRAAAAYQRVYYLYPLSAEAGEAQAALARLSAPVDAKLVLERAAKLIEAGDARRARRELEVSAEGLSGVERELTRVRIGQALLQSGEHAGALAYLKALDLESPEGRAERLYHIFVAARRLNREADMAASLDEVNRDHPNSPWRLETLLAAGYRFLRENQPARYEPLYRACWESFPDASHAPLCHWKTAWAAWLLKGPFEDRLREHLLRFPGSEKANTALYFLGRQAEERGDLGSARAFYSDVAARYPNSFYAMLSRKRLERPAVRGVTEAPEAVRFIRGLQFPSRPTAEITEVTPLTRTRIGRARLMSDAALDAWAEQELRFAARSGAQAPVVAMELAEITQRSGAVHRGIRVIKTLVPTYLFTPFERATERFWQLAFPLPFHDALERWSEQRSLDPYLFAALVRQESEFNPGAVSPAHALGLSQIRPPTGRELSRKTGVRWTGEKMLFQPETNLRLGTYHLRTLLNTLDGNWEATLAAYNAGLSRAVEWLKWAEFREPADFIETIPFTETRDYVQAVLRNADFYRRLYAGRPAQVSSTVAAAPATGVAPRKKSNGSARKNIGQGGGKSKRKSAVPKRPNGALR